MKVLMISGSYPPDMCGVGDYTARLIHSLSEVGISVNRLEGARWRIRSVAQIADAIARTECDIVHLQYPSEGYGMSLSPQLLSLKIPLVVTLHEFSNSRLLRKVACLPLIFSSKHLVFTSKYEEMRIQSLFPLTANKSSVIPIGTNISPTGEDLLRRFDEIIYFGLISPRKGLEAVLELAELAKMDNSNIQVRIVGQVTARFRKYADTLIAQSAGLPVIWRLEESASEVSSILAGASVAFLPFPDGASERRGSLKAVLSSGVVCISTAGQQTPDELRDVLVIASGVEDAFVKAKQLLNDRGELQRRSYLGQQYSKSFGWERIARSHISLYKMLCGC